MAHLAGYKRVDHIFQNSSHQNPTKKNCETNHPTNQHRYGSSGVVLLVCLRGYHYRLPAGMRHRTDLAQHPRPSVHCAVPRLSESGFDLDDSEQRPSGYSGRHYDFCSPERDARLWRTDAGAGCRSASRAPTFTGGASRANCQVQSRSREDGKAVDNSNGGGNHAVQSTARSLGEKS